MTVKSSTPLQGGLGLQSGDAISAALGYSAETPITALGTTQLTAYQLAATFNYVGTAAVSTGVRLPTSGIGAEPTIVFNGGASTLTIYPKTAAGTIDGGAAAAGVSLSAGSRCAFYQFDNDTWRSALLGAVSA